MDQFKQKLLEHREWEAKLKAVRGEIKELTKDYDETEENIKALQSVGQIIGEVLKQIDDERCELALSLREASLVALRILTPSRCQSSSKLRLALDMLSDVAQSSTNPS